MFRAPTFVGFLIRQKGPDRRWCSKRLLVDLTLFDAASYTAQSLHAIGQVAQLVERGPEKAGVGGSNPSLSTILFNKKPAKLSRVQSAYSVSLPVTFGVACSNKNAFALATQDRCGH